MGTYKKFLDRFESQYQLIIRNVENFAEYVSAPFSYITIAILTFLWLCVSVGFGLFIAKTVLAKWMNPIYIETENQKKILSLASTVETLEQQIESQEKFIATLQNIIQGKSSTSITPSRSVPATTPISAPKPIETAPPTVETNSSSIQPTTQPATTPIQSMSRLLFSPINGMISRPFNKKNGHYGVDIVAKEKDPIKAISTGIVIFSDWSVDTGWVISIQHHNNWVSICKHCAILFKKVGNLVKAGDVIALMGNSGEISTGPHLHFELWNEGVALNPEDFINF